MYVIEFEKVPSEYIPEEELNMHKTWLVNDIDRTRIPITPDAIAFHSLNVEDENKAVENTWNQMRLLNVFGFTLIPGVCEVPIMPTPEVVIHEAIPIVESVAEPVLEHVATPAEQPVHELVATPAEQPVLEQVAHPSEKTVINSLNIHVNNAVKDIYSNDSIQDKFVTIYESLNKVKSNSSLILDIIHEFTMMKGKGINVGAALPDLQTQHADLMLFEKNAIEEMNKINMLNKMIQEQINNLEMKCITKAKEIEDNN